MSAYNWLILSEFMSREIVDVQFLHSMCSLSDYPIMWPLK